MFEGFEQYLAHYGVKGQKWGTRQWQNEDGSYTEAGKERYWGGSGQRQRNDQLASSIMQKRKTSFYNPQAKNEVSSNNRSIQQEETKQRRNKILAIAGGVALAAVAAYGLYKGSSKLKEFGLKLKSIDYKPISKKKRAWMAAEDAAGRHAGRWTRKSAEYGYRIDKFNKKVLKQADRDRKVKEFFDKSRDIAKRTKTAALATGFVGAHYLLNSDKKKKKS